MAASRVVVRADDGSWEVRSAESKHVFSYHDRQADALARVKTVLKSAGGGWWTVCDETGREIGHGRIEAS